MYSWSVLYRISCHLAGRPLQTKSTIDIFVFIDLFKINVQKAVVGYTFNLWNTLGDLRQCSVLKRRPLETAKDLEDCQKRTTTSDTMSLKPKPVDFEATWSNLRETVKGVVTFTKVPRGVWNDRFTGMLYNIYISLNPLKFSKKNKKSRLKSVDK